MIDMTKAEVLAIWKGFVRNMSDQGAVFPFANEIASRARNSLLAQVEAAEKERENANAAAAAIALQAETLQAECDALRKELVAAHKMAMNGTEWRDLAKKYAARIEEMERQNPVVEVQWAASIPNSFLDFISTDGYLPKLGDKLYLAPGAQPAPSIPAVDALAQFIREIDGAHRLGAGVLAERIVAWIADAPEAKPCP